MHRKAGKRPPRSGVARARKSAHGLKHGGPMRTMIGAAVLSLALFGNQQPEPRITAVTPEAPVASQKPQTLTVTGEGFGTGLTLFLTTPGGAVKTFAGSDLVSQRSTSFQVSLALAE